MFVLQSLLSSAADTFNEPSAPCQVNEVQFSKSGFLFVAAGHPAGYGTFEIMRIVPEKKGNPNLENVHKVCPITRNAMLEFVWDSE